MKKQFDIHKIALTLGAIFLFCYFGSSQNNILELLPGAEKMGYNEKLGFHYLVGGVNFTYQGNTMYCDSAHYYDKNQEVKAYGNVHITKDDINLFCDSLYYNGKTRKAKLWSKVRVRDLEYKLTSDTVEYDTKQSLAIYRYGGKIESITSDEVLTSRVAYMYTDAKNFIFSGKVNYKTPDLKMTTDTLKYFYQKKIIQFYGPTNILNKKTKIYCEKGWYNTITEDGTLYKNASVIDQNNIISGDTLIYQPQKELMIGKGNVTIIDTSQKIEFRSNYAYSNEKTNISYITGKALVLKFLETKKEDKTVIDTLFIHSDTLYTLKDSSGKAAIVQGFHHVKMFKNDMQAMSDSLDYNLKNGTLKLYYSPIIWSHNSELKSDSMEVLFKDTIIEKVNLYNHSTVLMEIDSGKYYNQVGGKTIHAFFYANELIRTDVKGNAKTIFFPENTENTDTATVIKRMGMNRVYSSDIRVYLDSGEVKGITYFEKPDGVFYPMDQLNKEEQFIQDFKWNALLRPKTWQEILE
ncbi:MAG: hypothetical protein HYR91_01225 [Flavobacteriia bacterium]|nr:hypothetical protein [Flavobacteriia bacterium]